jgi:hydrophobic/amphiphilic exporter-1 (mainly G- bacteria), HAE1 family
VAATLALCLAGIVSLSRLPVSLLPDVALPVLTVRTVFPGAAAEEVSRLVAEPIEEAVASTPGLVELRSVSRAGTVTTVAQFAWGTDMPGTVLAVRERLDIARGRLPQTVERPTLLTSDPGARPIAILAVAGAPGTDLRSAARTARDVHARRLEQLAGVASVAIVGAPDDEIRVDVDPERMRALGLTPGDVAAAVRNANAAARGGTVRRGQFRYAVRALTEFRALQDIGGTPVGPSGSGVTLQDVATVRLASADPRTVVRLDGEPAVGLVVYKDAGANTVSVTRDIARTLDGLRAEVRDVRVTVVAEQARFVTDALGNLAQEIVLGGLLALLVIILMLGDVRGSLAVGLIVPLSVLVSLGVLHALDVTINVLSLGGLALAVGLLVDNAIVVAEATGRKREAGESRLHAARAAVSELSGPLIAGTLTTVLVFGPIVFVRGLAAALFHDLSLSVVASLTASLVLALTLMPVMLVGRRGYRDPAPVPVRQPRLTTAVLPLGRRLAEWYERGMRWSLARPRVVFGVAAAAVVVTAALTVRLPREILPAVDEGTIVAALQLPEGTALEETIRQVDRVEAAVRSLGASNIYARVGAATDEEILAGADAGSSAAAQLIVPLPPEANAARFAARLRGAVPDLAAGGALALDLAGQSEFGALIGRAGHTVRVEISAPGLDVAEAWADSVSAVLVQLPDLADVRNMNAASQPAVELGLERQRIARLGLALDRVADAVAGGLGGVAASELRETDRRTPIRVRLAGASNENLDAALATTVQGVPASQLVSVRHVRAPVEVVRVNQRPVTVVEAVAVRGGTARAARAAEEAVARLTPPAGVTWRLSGAEEERRRTSAELGVVALLSVALVYLVLAGEFASFTTPLLVMLTVPLAGAGSIVALWLTGQSLNVVALIGIVVMIGLADNEAVVKLAAIRRFRAAGRSVDQAVVEGGRQRLRAIGMTVLTTVAGVMPLLFGIGGGGALYRPLAAAVLGGSVSAMLVTFFLLPTAYALVERRRERAATRDRPA